MCKHSLIPLALISFSIVSTAAAIPMDADQAVLDAVQNVVLHKEVALVEGGGFDKDVADFSAVNICQNDAACSRAGVRYVKIGDTPIYMHQSVSDWFAEDSPGTLQSLMGWLTAMTFLFFFFFCKSTSTK